MKKLWIVCMTFLLCILPLAGCSKPAETGSGTTGSGVEASETAAGEDLEAAKITLYFVCDPPRDVQLVQDKLNEMFRKDLNTTIELKFSTWTDYTQKYDLALMSDDTIDLIYAAPWMGYSQYANQGAFLELDDLLPQYAPDLWDKISDTVWKQVSVKGNIYAVPSTNELYVGKGILYRQDLCDRYNLPVPDSIEDIESYLLGVKEKEPDMDLYSSTIEPNTSGETFGPHSLLMNLRWGLVDDEFSAYGLIGEYDNPSELFPYWGSSEFIEDMKTLKKWAELGFWSRSVMSEPADPTAFNNGKTAMTTAGLTPGKASQAHQQLAAMDPSYNAEYFLFANLHGNAWVGTPMSDMTAVPFTSKNPERALMVLNKLCMDEDYYRILNYGIEDQNYTLTDGVYAPILDSDGINGYDANAFDWAMTNPDYDFTSNSDDWYKGKIDELKKFRETTPFGGVDIARGFQEDYTDYQAERAALGNVIAQYLSPLEAGLVDDVDAAVKDFMDKAEAAGLSKIQKAYTEQWKTYCETYGYIKK